MSRACPSTLLSKTILITGSTDGIGLVTAELLVAQGHRVLLHGRNAEKLQAAVQALSGQGTVESYLADLSRLDDVEVLASEIAKSHSKLDVLINNAGVLNASTPVLDNGLDVRFLVNTLAPYLLTRRLMPLLGADGRVVNLSSAGQAPVIMDALAGRERIAEDLEAYRQSKLAITMWTSQLALELPDGPMIVAVNPGSLLGTKMVQEGFGISGKDIHIGAEILVRAALSDEFADASGRYYDNDAGRFSEPHPAGRDQGKCEELVRALDGLLTRS